MAIYHFSAKVISRAAGSSALAAAAYRSASRLHDQRLDRHHDFSNKAGVVHSEVLLPDGAPEHLRDRERLWNDVEAAEVRKERLELEYNADAERAELAGMLRARGVSAEVARMAAAQISENPEKALAVHAMEELGVDPGELPSPLAAAGASLLAFAVGAIVPLIPYLAGFSILGVALACAGLAALTGLLNSRSKRLGDLLAGTYSQLERVPPARALDLQLPPVLATSASNPIFTERGTPVAIWHGTTVDPNDSGESLTRMVLTVTGLADGSRETLRVAGSDLPVGASGTGALTGTTGSWSVSTSGSTATVTLAGLDLSGPSMAALVGGGLRAQGMALPTFDNVGVRHAVARNLYVLAIEPFLAMERNLAFLRTGLLLPFDEELGPPLEHTWGFHLTMGVRAD